VTLVKGRACSALVKSIAVRSREFIYFISFEILKANMKILNNKPGLIFGLIVVACLVGNAALVSVSVHWYAVTTVACTSVAAVEYVLDREKRGRPSRFPFDVDPVS
jgi:hypothetical protein